MKARYSSFVFLMISLTTVCVRAQDAGGFSLSAFSVLEKTARDERNALAAAAKIVGVCERFLEDNENAAETTVAHVAAVTAEIAGRLSISPASSPEATNAGTRFAAPFTAKIEAAHSEGTERVSCTAIYPGNNAGKTVFSEFEARPDPSSGASAYSAAFTPPAPQYGFAKTLEITFSFMAAAPLTRRLLSEREPETAGALTAAFPYRVVSAKNVPTVISVLDIDKNGEPVLSYSGESATALLKPVIQLGFKSTGMADFPEQLADGDERKLYEAANRQFNGTVKRFVYGYVRIDSVTAGGDGTYTAVLSSDIRIYDFSEKEKTGAYRFTAEASGETETQAVRRARETLCTTEIAPALEYGM